MLTELLQAPCQPWIGPGAVQSAPGAEQGAESSAPASGTTGTARFARASIEQNATPSQTFAAPRHTHNVTCPVCGAAFTDHTASAEPPAPMPCTACWRRLSPTDRAPYVLTLRTTPAGQRVCAHRDPMLYGASATALAYVEYLEAELAAQRGAR